MSEKNSRIVRDQLIRWWGAFLGATLVLSLLVSTRYYAVSDLDSSPLALAFRVAMLIGHFTVLCAVVLLPVLAAAMWWRRPGWVIGLAATLSGAFIVALLIDTQVYQLYRFHINAGVLNLLFGGAVRETFIFSREMYAQGLAIVAAVAVLLVATAILLWRTTVRTAASNTLRRMTTAVLLICTVSFHAMHIWADAVAYEPVVEQTAVLPLRYAATAKRFLRARGFEVRPGDSLAADRSESSSLSYPLTPVDCTGPSQPTNIVFIVVDSWRFDEMNSRVTPHVDRFARNATRFLDHHSGGNATRIGIFSLFYSIPGTYWHSVLREQRGPVFIEELLDLGYDIKAFRSTPITSPEFDRTVFANVKLSRVRSQGSGPAEWDGDLTSDFIDYLGARDDARQPFFALLFYDSPHSYALHPDHPLQFVPSAEHVNYFDLHGSADPTRLRNRYRNSIHYVDTLIGRVLDDLRARGLLESTIVVLTGDHGQEFNDTHRNLWGHGSAFSRYQTGVPLLLHIPGRAPGVFSHRTTHFDVAPTLLRDALGCKAKFETFSVGRSLFDTSERYPLVLSEYADFAIVERDRIAVVRKHGLDMFTPGYRDLDVHLGADAARLALEQKTRFYRNATRDRAPAGDRTRLSSSE